ncbi:MAG: alkaline phosphatase family protein [Saprospiraceae bacterium]|nr:alkaline phosphatase family protein [Saprospiraceae bacterium]
MKLRYFIIITGLFFLISCKNSAQQNDIIQEPKVSHLKADTGKIIETIVFGSCSKQALDQSYWNVIASKNPDLFIWMGDIIYSDTEDMKEHKKQYNLLKGNQYYSSFISKIPVIGIWDDHDFGVNDGGASYPKRKESKELLLDFLDIAKSDPVRSHEGIFTSYTFGTDMRKIKVYMLDSRYFRSDLIPNDTPENRYKPNNEGTILGKEQWQWLENEIKNSDASINIFISGIQVIPDDQPYEKWGNFPHERKRFLDLIEKYNIKNPLIFSGDRHLAELSEYTYQNFKGTITELTSSGLTHSFEGAQEYNAYRLGELFDGKNFGMIQVTWGGSKVMYKLFVFDIQGKKILEHGIISDY